jgi:aldose 1-epimerase
VTAFVRPSVDWVLASLSENHVIPKVTHTVENGGILKTTVLATASEKTPIMLTQHNYWNLDAFETPNPLDNHLFINASRLLEVDDMNIPTGKLTNVEGTPYDFRKSHTVGERLNDDELNYQYNQTWIFDEDQNKKIGVSMWSEESGIKCVGESHVRR